MLSVGMNLPKVTERLAQDGLMGRESLWRLAWEITRENPLLGLGPQQYANYHYHAIAAHPHSAYFQWMSEWGLVSLALICGLLVYGFTKWVKFCRHTLHKDNGEESIILISLTASLVAGATHALVSGIIVMPFSQMTMSLVIGWVLAIYFSDNMFKKTTSGVKNHQRIVLLIISVMFLGTISYTSYPAISQIDQLRENYLAKYPQTTILKPRFWRQGLIGW
jgi:O-antigen ligase